MIPHQRSPLVFRFVALFVKFASHPWLPLRGSCPNGTERAVGSILFVQITKEPFLSIIFSSNDLLLPFYSRSGSGNRIGGCDGLRLGMEACSQGGKEDIFPILLDSSTGDMIKFTDEKVSFMR